MVSTAMSRSSRAWWVPPARTSRTPPRPARRTRASRRGGRRPRRGTPARRRSRDRNGRTTRLRASGEPKQSTGSGSRDAPRTPGGPPTATAGGPGCDRRRAQIWRGVVTSTSSGSTSRNPLAELEPVRRRDRARGRRGSGPGSLAPPRWRSTARITPAVGHDEHRRRRGGRGDLVERRRAPATTRRSSGSKPGRAAVLGEVAGPRRLDLGPGQPGPLPRVTLLRAGRRPRRRARAPPR